MISVRQHVTSLVAVFLALAVGLALGGGLLGGTDSNGEDPTAGSPSPSEPSPGGGDATTGGADQQPDTFADAFAATGAARLYANGLDTHATAILTMPGADEALVKRLQAQIGVAGGSVTGTYAVGEALVDPANRDTIESVGGDLATQLADPRIDPAATSYDRMGILLALAMGTTQPSSVRADLAAVTIREALAGAQLLTSPADVRNAPLVLVVLPPGDEGTSDSLAARTMLSGLVNGLGTSVAGVVVLGDSDSAEDGELAALRGSEVVGPVSTVDGVDTTIGEVTAVLAMTAIFAGTFGSYGASGSDGAVPLQ
jgi:hypothetical protein